jgi:Kef-type K+ transport system membrane component KefB
MTLALLLLQIAVILSTCRILHGAIERAGQPPVIGEIIAGLLLGPSLLGWIAPTWYAYLFPPNSLPALNGLSQIGLLLFMFLVGLRFDFSELAASRRVAGLSALLSIVVPFCAGLALARPLHAFGSPGVPMTPFSLFIAVSMSITAFPVLARILSDHGLAATRLGHIAVACAAVDDVTAWSMLAWISEITRAAGAGASSPLRPLAIVAVYVGLMLGPVRTVLQMASRRFPLVNELPSILIFLFLSSWLTETAGLHALFGAFVAGVVWPRSEGVVTVLSTRIEPIAMAVLIPLFFSYTGIRTNIGLIQGRQLWLYQVLLIAVAVAAKAGGGFIGARTMGCGGRDSLALGALMNTRGLVELVVLNIGMDLHILSPALFSMMVVMALTTTLMTSPALRVILQERARLRHRAAAA